MVVSIDHNQGQTFDLTAEADQAAVQISVARGLSSGQHLAFITSRAGNNVIDGFIVRRPPNLTTPLFLAAIAAIGLAYVIIRRRLP